jgi:hypothetical protein
MQNSDLWKSSVARVICAAMVLTVTPSDSRAGVMNIAQKPTISPTSLVDQIYYRRYRHRHYSRHRSQYVNSDNNDAALARAGRAFVARELTWMHKYYGYYGYPHYFYGYPYYSNYGRGGPCYGYNWSYPCASYRWTYPPNWF